MCLNLVGLKGCPGFVVLVPPIPAVFWLLTCLVHHSVCNADYLRLRYWLDGCSGKFRALVENLDEALERLPSVVWRSDYFIVSHHALQGYAGIVLVNVFDVVHG